MRRLREDHEQLRPNSTRADYAGYVRQFVVSHDPLLMLARSLHTRFACRYAVYANAAFTCLQNNEQSDQQASIHHVFSHIPVFNGAKLCSVIGK